MNLNNSDIEEINVNQIQEIHYQRLKKRVDIFDKVLKQCYQVIKQAVSKEDEWCIYTIPEIMFGNPLYKIPDCANYIYRSLKKNGFNVKYIFPNYLVIIWSYKNNRQAMLDYPIITPQQSINNTMKSYTQPYAQSYIQPNVQSYALPAPPIKKVEKSNSIDILKKCANRESNKITHSTKEFRPSGMFLFNKKH